MDLELRDRAFLITGGSDGLGLALAQRLVNESAHVAICGRDKDRLARAQTLLGPEALCFVADVTSRTKQTRSSTRHWRVSVDSMVPSITRGAARTSQSRTRRMTCGARTTNSKSSRALHVSRRVIEPLTTTQGSIINVLSIQARTPSVNSTPTTASRARGSRSPRQWLASSVREACGVNAILIGLIESGNGSVAPKQSGQPVEDFYASLGSGANIPLGRVGRAEEFADSRYLLLSPRASYLHGRGYQPRWRSVARYLKSRAAGQLMEH